MQIKYFSEKKAFVLENEKISYIFFVNEKGMLQHLYFGQTLNFFDIDSMTDTGDDWSRFYLEPKSHKESKTKQNIYLDHSLFELPISGSSDKRPEAIKLHDKSDLILDFRFVSYEISKGLPEFKALPFIRDEKKEGETLSILLKEVSENIYISLCFSILPDLGLIIRNTKIINKTARSLFLTRGQSISLDIPRNDFDLIHFPGEWADERQVKREEIHDGTKLISSKTGRSSHEENSFFFLIDHNGGEDYGDAYGFSFLYSGGFNADITTGKWSATRISLGIDDSNLLYEIKPNDNLDLPEGTMFFSSKGLTYLSQDIHDTIRNHLIKIPNWETKESILLNSWEGCYFNFNTEKIISFIDSAKDIGAELFVLDDGWFGKRNDDTSSLGDWYVNKEKIDLQKIIDHTHEAGMKFGLWFEPEMISPDSDLFKKHPEYAIYSSDHDSSVIRHQLPLDLTNPEARKHIYEKISDILSSYKIDYVKWDHNRTIDEECSSYLDDKHQGEFSLRMTLGYYDLVHKLIDRFPNILFQGCASGGGRFDLGSLFFFPEIWTSDETDPIQRLFIQYGTSYMYPFITQGAHVSQNKITSYQNKAFVALFGSYGFEFDPSTLSEKETRQLKEANEIFHKYHLNCVSKGDLFRLSSPFTSNNLAWLCLSKDKKEGLILFASLLKEPNRYRFLKLRGLKKDSYYMNSLDKKIYSGDYYQKVGLNLSTWLDEFSFKLISLTEIKDEKGERFK